MTRYEILSPQCDISHYFGEEHEWPTVVAVRDNKIVGALSTHTSNGAVICGPLKVSVPNPGWVIVRLVEAYDRQMMALGLKSYLCYVDTMHSAKSEKWLKVIEKTGYVEVYNPHADDGAQHWFRRILVSKRSWGQSLRRTREKLTTAPTVVG